MYVLKITTAKDFTEVEDKIVDNQCPAIAVIKIHLTPLAGDKNNST